MLALVSFFLAAYRTGVESVIAHESWSTVDIIVQRRIYCLAQSSDTRRARVCNRDILIARINSQVQRSDNGQICPLIFSEEHDSHLLPRSVPCLTLAPASICLARVIRFLFSSINMTPAHHRRTHTLFRGCWILVTDRCPPISCLGEFASLFIFRWNGLAGRQLTVATWA